MLIGIVLAWFIRLGLPEFRSFADYRPPVASILMDREGAMLDLVGPEQRITLPLAAMGAYLPQAFVAAEDARFWEHPGLDGWSILRAMVNNLRSGRRAQGGSTITQQVTRALMLSREKTYFRKAAEAFLAWRLEGILSKKEILTIYLNEIYLGDGAYGVEAAARRYFGKGAASLSLGESALLAGLVQSPSRYSPRNHLEEARARQRYVLNRMAEDQLISDEAAREAYAAPVLLSLSHGDGRNGWFCGYVQELLEAEYGKEKLYQMSLQVTTTVDSGLQDLAQQVVRDGAQGIRKRQKAMNGPQGALLAMDGDGRIRSMIGGLDFTSSPFNRAVAARRQPGSVFKPLIYATALEQGVPPGHMLDDSPFVRKGGRGRVWRPANYTGDFLGPTSLVDALVNSRNIPTIRLLQEIGVQTVIGQARKSGLQGPFTPDLTLALGTSPVSLLEMTALYSAFSNQGLLHSPLAISRVRGQDGRIKPWSKAEPQRVFKPETAQAMRAILTQVVRRGTGQAVATIPGAAGKTGTTNDNVDAWFIGFAGDLTCGIWYGHDRQRSLGKSETGAQAAAPVWKAFMEKALQEK